MTVKVEQTLHGYSNGHSLLANSIRLSSEVERLMLSLSDMSGTGMRSGFDSYLTAYPVLSEQIYVIARTWHAPEMRRPGCVWTHSILIRNDDLPDISDAQMVTRLLRRPVAIDGKYVAGTNDLYGSPLPLYATNDMSDSYASPIENEMSNLGGYGPESIADTGLQNVIVRELLWSLYGASSGPVYIPARGSRDYESVILRLWSQQWPQLRSTFSFCTGALANRTLRGKAFDLQVIPKEASSELRRDLAQGMVIGTLDQPFRQKGSAWLSAAVDDLLSNFDPSLRRKAWELGPFALGGRLNFPAVFYLAWAIRKNAAMSADQYVEDVMAGCTELNTPSPLLKAVLTAAGPSAIDTGFSESELLRALSSVEPSPEFENRTDDLEIAGRAQRLWKEHQSAALNLFSQLIRRDSTTKIGDQILFGMCQAFEAKDVEVVAHGMPDMASVVVKQKVVLATSPAIWQTDWQLQVRIFHAVMSAPITDEMLGLVVDAILRAGSDVLREQAYHYGDRFVIPVLNWLNGHIGASGNAAGGWKPYLRLYTKQVAEWLAGRKPSKEMLTFLASVLPADIAALSRNLTIWLPLRDGVANLPEADRTPVAAFLFALALRNCEGAALSLLEDSFQHVYDVAELDRLDYEYWRPIENIASPVSWRYWDKCERICAVLVDRFIECGWSPFALLKIIHSPRTLAQAFGLARTTKTRKQFLKRVAEVGLGSQCSAAERRILEAHK